MKIKLYLFFSVIAIFLSLSCRSKEVRKYEDLLTIKITNDVKHIMFEESILFGQKQRLSFTCKKSTIDKIIVRLELIKDLDKNRENYDESLYPPEWWDIQTIKMSEQYSGVKIDEHKHMILWYEEESEKAHYLQWWN